MKGKGQNSPKLTFEVAIGKRTCNDLKDEESKVLDDRAAPNLIGNHSSATSSAFLPLAQKTASINPILQSLLMRQKRGRKHEATDQQKQLEIIARISDPNFSKAESARRRTAHKLRNEQTIKDTRELIAEMDTAHDADH